MSSISEISRKQNIRKSLAPELNKFHNRDIPRPTSEFPQSREVDVNDELALASSLFGMDLTHNAKKYADLSPYKQPAHKYGRTPIRGLSDNDLINVLFERNPHLERKLRFGEYEPNEGYENKPETEIERRLLKTRNPKFFFALREYLKRTDPHFDNKSFYEAYRDKVDWIRPPKY